MKIKNPGIFIGMLFFSVCQLDAQYKVSNNERIVIAQAIDTSLDDNAQQTAVQFFQLAAEHKRAEWNKLLCNECTSNEQALKNTERIWKRLSSGKEKFTYASELSAAKTNQRTVVFNSNSNKKTHSEVTLILVKENGRWKILTMN